ncbi:hypothetical protein Ocin01_15176 [Orchesella cincta]|uniref:Ankyrin-3 n=1 Tax=Orchesella cincta TaxID=48709 RepID=A0A1D2MEV0_ORCCI|nr:hypothetical protein Ocin01_15176 [Orchesella cincta]
MKDYIQWIHACVRENLYELLKVIIKFGENQEVFETEDILLLALKFADLPIIKLVVKHYAQQSLKNLKDIKLELKWTGDDKEMEIITMLHVAALRGNYSVMQYLLKIHGFEDLVKQQHICEILCFCVVGTYTKDEEIHERKRIINDLLNINPSLIEGVNKLRFTPLLYPNIHFDLVILLIDLGVNVDATNFISNNMLHLFPEYFTPEEYDKVVHHLENSGKTKLFHSLNKRQETPLYRAILYFDLLDSTIDIFARAGFDFNVPIENTTTLLSHAIEEERSARLLDSLVRSGADINKRVGKYVMTPLHKAVSQDNLSALRYLISRGVDVNAVDNDKETPLHLALRLPGRYSYRIVQSLLQHDADINAVDTLNRTPISNAEESYKNGKISKQTLELLEKRLPKQAQVVKEDVITLSKSKTITIDGTSYIAETLFINLEKISQVFIENAITSWDECRIVKFNIGHKVDRSKCVSRNSQNLCTRFPSCTCKNEEIMVEFNFKFVKCNHKRLNVSVSIHELLPVLRDILNLNDSLKLFEVKRLFRQVYHLPYNIDILRIMEKPNDAQVLSHISQGNYLLGELLSSLGNSESERNQLKHIAVNTLFPNFTRNIDVKGFDDYLKSGILKYDGKLVFTNSDLAWCLISELLLNFEKSEFADLRLNGMLSSIFNDCVDCKKLVIWHSIGLAAEEMETFTFKNHIFFNSLEHLLSKKNSENSLRTILNKNLTKDNVDKCLQASVIANLPNLLRILLSTLGQTKLFESRHFVGLAVKFSGFQIMELVIEQYIRQTDNQIKHAKLSVSDPYYVIPVLHIAALRGDFSVMRYLLEKHAFKDRLHYSKLDNILHHCVIHTCKFQGNDVIERQRIIRLLVELHPQLIHKKDKFNRTPLMVPYANVELIILLINLGVDVSATNNQSKNVLHICAEYLDPQGYDKLLRCLSNRGDTKIFHPQDSFQETPLSRAVTCLDALDSSLKLFSTINVDFNAENSYKNTVLVLATLFHRSSQLLDSLIRFGADIDKRGFSDRTALHSAAEVGNLNGLKYFISKGCDVNAKDKDDSAPLHLAVKYSKINTHEIIEVLITQGADVNALDNEGDSGHTPLHTAFQGESTVHDVVTELLKHGCRYPIATDKDENYQVVG